MPPSHPAQVSQGPVGSFQDHWTGKLQGHKTRPAISPGQKQSRNPPLVLTHIDKCLLRARHDKGFVATASPHRRAKPLRDVPVGQEPLDRHDAAVDGRGEGGQPGNTASHPRRPSRSLSHPPTQLRSAHRGAHARPSSATAGAAHGHRRQYPTRARAARFTHHHSVPCSSPCSRG